MHPVLFHLPLPGAGLDIPTYGVLLATAFLIILRVAGYIARRDGMDARAVLDLSLTVFLAGLVGAKILLVVIDLPFYLEHPQALLGTLRSAGVFYGGLLAAVPVGIWFARRRRLPLWKVADLAGVCIPIGLAVGRLGCFAAGCCYGTSCVRPWAVTFTSETAHLATGVPLDLPLHPSQIYLALNAGALAAVLFWRHRHRAFTGEIFLLFVILYGATRSFWEIFRGDEIRGFLISGWVSTSQAIGMASVVAALAVLVVRRRAVRQQPR